MSGQIEFPKRGENFEARGRNGWFTPRTLHVWGAPNSSKDCAYLEIQSNKIGRSAPITLYGPREEIIRLLEKAVRELRRMEPE